MFVFVLVIEDKPVRYILDEELASDLLEDSAIEYGEEYCSIQLLQPDVFGTELVHVGNFHIINQEIVYQDLDE